MRTLLIASCPLAFAIGCLGPDLADYCGEPASEAASWEDGSEATAAELRDGLLGLWEGTVSFEGSEQAATLVVNEPSDDPSFITYPDAGDGYTNVHVADACLDTLEVLLPAQLILEDSGVDLTIELAMHETGFSAGWSNGQVYEIPGCEAEPCALGLSFARYQADSDELEGKLQWVDTTVDEDVSSISDTNLILSLVTE